MFYTVWLMNVKPLPDQCFVKFEGVFDGYNGPLFMPESVKKKVSVVARVIRDNLTARSQRAFQGLKTLAGMRVIINPYSRTEIKGIGHRIPQDAVLAVLDDSIEVELVSTEGPERCRFCGPVREGTLNSVILASGVCPRCKKDRDGNIKG